jgi:hypothetical protein
MQMTMIFSDVAYTARGLPMLEHKDFFWSLLHGLWRAASSHMKSGSSNLKKKPETPKTRCFRADDASGNPQRFALLLREFWPAKSASSLCLILFGFWSGVKAREAAWCTPTRCVRQRTRT